jgi:hypothetical protein
MQVKPRTLDWYRSTAARASCSALGIRPEMSTISQLTNWTMVNAP